MFKSWPPGLGWGHNGEGIKYYWALFKAKILCLIFKTSVYSFRIQKQNFSTKRIYHSVNSINELDFDQLFLRDWMPAFIFIFNCLLLIWNIWNFFPHTLISHRVNSWLTLLFWCAWDGLFHCLTKGSNKVVNCKAQECKVVFWYKITAYKYTRRRS